MTPPFIIHALGRSRTAWLAQFLSYGEWVCRHEQAIHMREVEDIGLFFRQRKTGTVETAASFGWPLIKHFAPRVRQVVVLREPSEAIDAMQTHYRRSGIPCNGEMMRSIFHRGAKVLSRISALPDVLTLSYRDLETEDGCKRVFEFCLPYAFDRAWWAEMRERHVDTDLAKIVSYYQANREAIERFKRLCKIEMFRVVRLGEV